jgi:DNA-binding CsgD family transcriptional regulator
MGLLDFFIRRKPTKRRRSKGCNITSRQQIAGIKGQIDLINSVLKEHRKDIDKNSVLLKEHGQKLTNLEDILTNQPMNPRPIQTSPTQRPDWAAKPAQSNVTNSCKFDIDRFSNQEKRILQIFFQHPDMALSYRDIAHALAKSPNTIKNELRQLNMKADLFTKNVDAGNRNRFKLKDGLKIEKYLNIDRPSDQPVDIGRLT